MNNLNIFMDNKTIQSENLWNCYFHPPEYLLGIAMAITGAGHCLQTQISRVINRRYPDHTFVLSYSGGASLDFRGRHFELTRHDCFFIPEMEIHTYGTDPGQLWESYWISFKAPDNIIRIWESLLPTPKNVRDSRLLSCFMRIRELYLENAAPESYTAVLFSVLATLRLPQEAGNSNPADAVIEDTHKYIIENLDKNLSLDEISERAGFSATHFARLFKKRYGMPVTEYIISRRIAGAQMLLATTQMPIKNIAHQSGFTDQLYFSRIFRKKLHITPGDFRRFYRQG